MEDLEGKLEQRKYTEKDIDNDIYNARTYQPHQTYKRDSKNGRLLKTAAVLVTSLALGYGALSGCGSLKHGSASFSVGFFFPLDDHHFNQPHHFFPKHHHGHRDRHGHD